MAARSDTNDAPVMHMASVPEAIEWQARHAENGGAPGTARVIRALLPVLDSETAVGRRMTNWQGLTLEDAMPLRIHGGLHNLLVTGEDRRLEEVYAGRLTRQAAVDELVCELVQTYDTRLLPWLDGPPQTNEAGRSASIMAGLLWLAERVPARFEMLELGASAGVNTMMDRYRYDLGGVTVGPAKSPVLIAPEWRGNPPPAVDVEIASIRGCDVAPVDLTDPEAAMRLKSYVWPEMTARMGRIDAAIAMATERAPNVERMSGEDWVERELARPSQTGVTRVLFHSIVWQYLPPEGRERITRAVAQAATRATAGGPLAWLTLETNRRTFAHELRVRYWPGGAEDVLLAQSNPHGVWVDWFGE
ncbi:Aminoacyl-tRNA hydrolase [Alteripontixanthobacter maritimus]|uniref:Aminoacyl-tRNA hydrolase n=1 Tax=Alteripontixanthobacter maritimus TaxID=2161824 RepID=A0A369QC16_9SPHN|nr:DUF2332 domain-containing protein [Alteripontixanthobacter maritimus]RDC60459.1 Aminoacyl-tRNA hydrolase [Alteripontixanthobacter maritimus]